jgi:hypothetical protein
MSDNMSTTVSTISTIGPLTTTGVTSYTGNGSYGTISIGVITDNLLDKYEFNKVVVDHKVQEQELMKLKEVAPDYANEIKENLAKNATRDIIKKMSFTRKHDKDTDVHHFIGRVWVFTEDELKKLIEDIKNA